MSRPIPASKAPSRSPTPDESPYSERIYREFVTNGRDTPKGGYESDQDSNNRSKPSFTDAERKMYALEWQDNFRWLSKLAGSYGGRNLTEVASETKRRVDEIGVYSELVYSQIDVELLFKHPSLLSTANILPEYHPILSDCTFISKIYGEKTELSAFVVYRRRKGQLIVSISGSSRPKHMLENLRVLRKPWHGASHPSVEDTVSGLEPLDDSTVTKPSASESEPSTSTKQPPVPSVHSGFLRLYRDIKPDLHTAILDGIMQHRPQELIITGHSMGGSVSHLLCLDLLSGSLSGAPLPQHITLATYGAPRTGNAALVLHFRGLVDAFRAKGEAFRFDEYAVKAYNDGVPAVPPRIFGYAHFAQRPLYAFHKRLYAVPPGNEEASLFQVDIPPGPLASQDHKSQGPPDGTHVPPGPTDKTLPQLNPPEINRFPRGGHNYYNGRDLEGFRRVTAALGSAGFPSEGWETRFGGKAPEPEGVGAGQQCDTVKDSSPASQQ